MTFVATPELLLLTEHLARRDPISNKIRHPYKNDEAVSFWTAGTRVVITEDGDFAIGRCGRIIESRYILPIDL